MRLNQFNPKALALRKFMYETLGQKYMDYEDLVERVSAMLVTDKDVTDYARMIGEVYELGYRKAVDDYKEQLAKLGVVVNVTTQTPG